MMTKPLHKFTDIHDTPHVYQDTYERSTTTGPDRLVIAPASNHVELLCLLLGLMPGPFRFLYILVVSRTLTPEGRYELDQDLSREEMTTLLMEHREFFEADGRHTLFIGSQADNAMLVYDRHNVIYAYGDLDKYSQLLVQSGFRSEDVRFPVPHAHHYHDEMDDEETRLLRGRSWIQYPLKESDRE